jgi:hypothetical protein
VTAGVLLSYSPTQSYGSISVVLTVDGRTWEGFYNTCLKIVHHGKIGAHSPPCYLACYRDKRNVRHHVSIHPLAMLILELLSYVLLQCCCLGTCLAIAAKTYVLLELSTDTLCCGGPLFESATVQFRPMTDQKALLVSVWSPRLTVRNYYTMIVLNGQ